MHVAVKCTQVEDSFVVPISNFLVHLYLQTFLLSCAFSDLFSLLCPTASPFFLSRPQPTLHPILSLYVELNCTVVGQIPLEVLWFKDGNTPLVSQGNRISIELSSRESIVSAVLRIVSVEEEDAGVYTCLAKDDNGTSSTSTTIDVRGV